MQAVLTFSREQTFCRPSVGRHESVFLAEKSWIEENAQKYCVRFEVWYEQPFVVCQLTDTKVFSPVVQENAQKYCVRFEVYLKIVY